MLVAPNRRSISGAKLLLLLVALACGGSGGDSTGVANNPDVAAVIVSGAPSGPAMVGESINLVATATNASGGVISGPNVTWSSSAPAVASVTSSGVVKALTSGRATIKATVGSHEGTATLDVVDGGMVGTQGGVVTAAGGVVTLNVPAGGVPQPTLISVRPAANPVADTRVLTSTAFDIGPLGSQLQGVLTIRFDPAQLPAGIAGESLQLYTISAGNWVLIPGSTVDLTAKTVTGPINGMGTYAIRSTPVQSINVAGAAVGGALFGGQSAQLTASLIGPQGQTLPARPLTWTSSDPSKVTVDATGKVTAVAQGSATITVSTDGKSGTASLTILARPTADWSRATDWVTYQGDSRHSGFIDATLDPVAFKAKWLDTITTSGNLNPPTVGGGRLYVSTNYYFTAQTLHTLDPATGARGWTRDFGAIFGLNQPTYDAGSVYVTTGGHQDTYLYALNASDGSLKYQSPFDSQWEHWRAPVIAGSSIVTAGGYYGGWYGFDLATGAQTFFAAGPQVDNWGPVAQSSTVYRTGGTGLTAVTASTGTVVGTLNDARLTGVTTPVIGDANDLLTITSNRLMSVDLGTMSIKWDQSGSYTGMPVVGNGTVYGFSGTVVSARRESDGTLLWSWQPPSPYIGAAPASIQSIALTDNILFVSLSSSLYSPQQGGTTFAIDLASHLTVWSYPMSGDIALSSQGYLFIVQNGQVAGIAVK